jgi:hypothetical protein
MVVDVARHEVGEFGEFGLAPQGLDSSPTRKKMLGRRRGKRLKLPITLNRSVSVRSAPCRGAIEQDLGRDS